MRPRSFDRSALVFVIPVVSLLLGGGARSQQPVPLLDEVMGYEETGAIKFDPNDPNHRSVARFEFLGCTISADGDYQYWYDIVSGNKAWTRDVAFWVSNGDTITNMADSNYTETGAEHVLEHWWGSPMAHKGLDGWGGHRDWQNRPSHGNANSWTLTSGHPDPILNQFHDPIDYNVPGHWTFTPTVFFWGPPSRTDDSLTLSDGTSVWRFEKSHNAQLLNAGMNPYAFGGLCGTFIIESPKPPAENALGWSTYHNTTVDSSVGPVTSFGYLPGPGTVASAEIFLKVSQSGGNLDFAWNSRAGMKYDLLSSTDLTTDPSTWPTYDDGVTIYGSIIHSETGTNTLTGVRRIGSKRFFAVIEEEIPPLFSENFDGVAALPPGWTSTGADATGWEVGAPFGAAFGPIVANSPPNCVATNINSEYNPSQDVSLVTPVIAVPATGATLSYQQWRDTEGDGDAASVRVLDADNNDSLIVELVTGIEGNDNEWNSPAPVVLPNATHGRNIKLEFRFISNDLGGAEYAGFYLDDVRLEAN